MGGFAGRAWSLVRVWVKTACGRRRFNVLGALNFATKKVETVVNDTYITSAQIIEMLEMLACKYTNAPIKIILDNARYQRCKIVFETAERLNVELVYLPTYSPNLNLIERVWRLVKSRVLSGEYHETFSEFSGSIENTIDELHAALHDDMVSLISDKFHIINEKNIIAA
jgi:transposase